MCIPAGGDGAGHISGKDLPVALRMRVCHRCCGEQGLGVGMKWLLVERMPVRQLHQATEVHDRHPVTDVIDHAQVMGNENAGQAEPVLEFLKQVDDLGLDGNVAGGQRQGYRASVRPPVALFKNIMIYI